jgi:hypothetical protein
MSVDLEKALLRTVSNGDRDSDVKEYLRLGVKLGAMRRGENGTFIEGKPDLTGDDLLRRINYNVCNDGREQTYIMLCATIALTTAMLLLSIITLCFIVLK